MSQLTQDEKFKILGLLESLEPDHKFNLNNIIREETKRQLEDVKAHMQPSPETLRMFETFGEKMKAIQDHLKKQDEDFLEFKKTFKPISETFDTGIRIKKWGWGFLMLISVVSGLIFGWFAFLKPFFKKIFGE